MFFNVGFQRADMFNQGQTLRHHVMGFYMLGLENILSFVESQIRITAHNPSQLRFEYIARSSNEPKHLLVSSWIYKPASKSCDAQNS